MIATTPSWTDILGAIALAVAALAGSVALAGAYLQLRLGRRQSAQERAEALTARAHRYLERYGNPDELPQIAAFHAFMNVAPDKEAGQLRRWRAMGVLSRLKILRFLNFWEELAGMYNRGLVDRDLVQEYFGAPALYYLKMSHWFIRYEQKREPDALSQFQQMCKDIGGPEAIGETPADAGE